MPAPPGWRHTVLLPGHTLHSTLRADVKWHLLESFFNGKTHRSCKLQPKHFGYCESRRLFWLLSDFPRVLALRTNNKVTGRERSCCDTVNKETHIYKHTSPLSVLYALILRVLLPHQRPQQVLNCFLVRIIALWPNDYVLYSTASIQINRSFLTFWRNQCA